MDATCMTERETSAKKTRHSQEDRRRNTHNRRRKKRQEQRRKRQESTNRKHTNNNETNISRGEPCIINDHIEASNDTSGFEKKHFDK